MKWYQNRKWITVMIIMLVFCLTACGGNTKKNQFTQNSKTEGRFEKESSSVSNTASKEESTEHKPEENISVGINTSSGNVSSKGKTETSSIPQKNNATVNHSSKRPPVLHQTGCQHTWVTRTETKQEPIKTMVTAERREYTLYRFYWYPIGKWEETRDHKRFDEWMKSENGYWYTIYHPYPRPEDNPLFIGYDEHGHETYTNNHVIVSNLFEWVPCEPYEKIEMTTMTVTSTVCSKCGVLKYDELLKTSR